MAATNSTESEPLLQRSDSKRSEPRSSRSASKSTEYGDTPTTTPSTRTSTRSHKKSSEESSVGSNNTIVWKNIVATVPQKSKGKGKEERRTVINDVTGVAHAGEVLAIMGGSGAGKTTLMNILAHLTTKGVEKTGVVLVNGRQITKSEMRSISAYVQQVDIFCGALTVREQLTYSALLRMKSSFSKSEKMAKVEEVIKEMNLTDCQNTAIGIPNRVKGISIGEKKRLAFACEVLTDPAILFCDEPTSGLDSFMACQVVTALHLMAQKGKTVISVIHQPSSTVFNMFHKVCFMANGRAAYHGPVKELCPFFDSMHKPRFRCPESYNPADHALRILSIAPETAERDIGEIKEITEQFEKSHHYQEIMEEVTAATSKIKEGQETKITKYNVSFFTQVIVLFRRAFFTVLRDPILLRVKLIQVILTAIVVGMVNWRVELKGATVQNLEGVLYNTARDMNFLFMFPSINVITSELPIIFREYKAGIYSIPSYYVSKSLAEFPLMVILPVSYSIFVYWMTGLMASASKFFIFIGVSLLLSNNAVSLAFAAASIFGDEGTAVTYMPLYAVPMLVCGGFYVSFHMIPKVFTPFTYLSWFRYGFEALQVNQWEEVDSIPGCDGNVTASICPGRNGTEILEKRGMHQSIALNVLVLFIFTIGYRLIGLIALVVRAKLSK